MIRVVVMLWWDGTHVWCLKRCVSWPHIQVCTGSHVSTVICACTYMCTRVYITCVHVYILHLCIMYTCVHVWMHAYVYVYICVYAYMYASYMYAINCM